MAEAGAGRGIAGGGGERDGIHDRASARRHPGHLRQAGGERGRAGGPDTVRRSGRRPGWHRGAAMGRARQGSQAADPEPAGPAAQAAGHRAGQHPHRRRTTPKGYYLHQFKEAFARYLGPEGASEPQHRNNADEMGTSDLFQSATAETDVAVRKCEKPNNDGPCCGVADEKGDSGEERSLRRRHPVVRSSTLEP